MAMLRKPLVRVLIETVTVGVAYYLSAVLSLSFTKGVEGIAVIWPASGMLLAILIVTPARRRAAYLTAIMVASLAANLGGGMPAFLAIGFTVANVTEPLVALYLLKRLGVERPRFDEIGDVGRFTVATGAASFWSAGLASTISQMGISFFLSWLTTVFMGIMFVTPILVTMTLLRDVRWVSLEERRSRLEVGAWMIVVALVSWAVFSQNSYPVLFLPPVAVLAATYRLNSFGAAASVLIVAIVATILTGQGSGPVHFVHGGDEAVILFLQFYLLVQLASALPLAATLAARVRMSSRLLESNRLLKQAEAAAKVGHWRIDLKKKKLFWSDEVFRIYGRTAGNPPALMDGLNNYVAEDRTRVEAILRESIKTGRSFAFEARIARADGSVRHIVSRGEPEGSKSGRTVAIFGSIQDISVQVDSAQKLKKARNEAEAAAKSALRLAHTDVLTGLPNRRHTMAALNRAVSEAKVSGAPFSIAMFDIDHFKSVNDNFGHACGDEVLRGVARSAVRAGRSEDLIGRIGGEEFLMLLPNTDTQTALRAAERIRAAIERDTSASKDFVRVTISVGVAGWKEELTGETLFGLADKALYDAKIAGRNLICLVA